MRQAGDIFLNGKPIGLYENGVTAYGVEITDVRIKGFEPRANHPGGGFFGPRACGGRSGAMPRAAMCFAGAAEATSEATAAGKSSPARGCSFKVSIVGSVASLAIPRS